MEAPKYISYRVNGSEIRNEPMIYKRLYAVGQSLVDNSQLYLVKSVTVDNEVQIVQLEKARVCARCKMPPDLCLCR